MKIDNLFKVKPYQQNHLLNYTQNFIFNILKLKNNSLNQDIEYILSDISFAINLGSINMIIGPNGAGKSSLSKIIANLDQDYIGTIKSSFKNLGYLPQNCAINDSLPIDCQHLLNILKYKKKQKYISDFQKIHYNQETIEKINNLTKDIQNKQINLLSGGSFKRLLLQSVLMNDYDFIILDEPNQNLDLESEEMLYDIILHLKTQYNITFIIISHDLYNVMKYADKVICINKHICCTGKPSEIIKNSKFLAIYKHMHKFCDINH